MTTPKIDLTNMKVSQAWAWITEDGQVRGTLNMQTGAYQVPAIVLVDQKHIAGKKDKRGDKV